ncbi:MAG: LysR family transcriptional regulator [Oscillospiraceae bacterium]|nr:LysR family transcriptional regulator [Oscillospiraceae bacterium]
MNFRNLQYFLRAAEEKNITRAAQKLYISQQSLSGHIAKLEEELGVSLFERGGELTLTYAGERLYLLAQRICSLEQEILRETGEISDRRRGRLRLGISYTCGRAILPRLLPLFHADHPQVEISLMEGNHQKLNEWLAAGEIDVVLGYMPIDVPGALVYPLLQERLFLACPRAIADSAFGAETAQTLRREGWRDPDIRALRGCPFILLKSGNRIRTMFDAYLAKKDFLPEIILETENIETAFALAEQGMGITVYPELFLNTLHAARSAELDLLALPADDTTGTLAAAFLEKGYHAPAVLDFISLCRQRAGEWV